MRLIFIIFCTFCTMFAQNLDFKSIQTNFTQTIKAQEGGILKYSGKLYAKKPNLALWIYEKPMNKSVYFNNSSVLINEPELMQVIISTQNQIPNISTIIKNSKQLSPNKFVGKFDDIDYEIIFQNNIPHVINYKDKLDNDVSIMLTQTVLDQNIDDDIFNFKIPSDYDIIRQ